MKGIRNRSKQPTSRFTFHVSQLRAVVRGAASPSATPSALRHCLPVGRGKRHSLAVENIAKATATV
ncbi:MAG: hypothetical protein WCK27_30585 [Verrucomicrobiota bacterium]